MGSAAAVVAWLQSAWFLLGIVVAIVAAWIAPWIGVTGGPLAPELTAK